MDGAPPPSSPEAEASEATALPVHLPQLWNVHGIILRIPPPVPLDADHRQISALGFSDETNEPKPNGTGFASYSVWARLLAPDLYTHAASRPARTRAAVPAKRPATSGFEPLTGPVTAEEEAERWARSWSTVVRRDVPKQQRALANQQRENMAQTKRVAIAMQKEMRRRAVLSMRQAAPGKIQLRCKELAKELPAAFRARELLLLQAERAKARSAWRASHRSTDGGRKNKTDGAQRACSRAALQCVEIESKGAAARRAQLEAALGGSRAEAFVALLRLRFGGCHSSLVTPTSSPLTLVSPECIARGSAELVVPPRSPLQIVAPGCVWRALGSEEQPRRATEVHAAAQIAARLMRTVLRMEALEQSTTPTVYWSKQSSSRTAWRGLLPFGGLDPTDPAVVVGALKDAAVCFAALAHLLRLPLRAVACAATAAVASCTGAAVARSDLPRRHAAHERRVHVASLSWLPSSPLRSLLREHSKLAKLDSLLAQLAVSASRRSLRSVLIFVSTPAAPLVHRLLKARRIPTVAAAGKRGTGLCAYVLPCTLNEVELRLSSDAPDPVHSIFFDAPLPCERADLGGVATSNGLPGGAAARALLIALGGRSAPPVTVLCGPSPAEALLVREYFGGNLAAASARAALLGPQETTLVQLCNEVPATV